MSRRLAVSLVVFIVVVTYWGIQSAHSVSQQPSTATTCRWSDYAPHGSNCK